MSESQHIGIIGAGIVGLSTALHLQQAGLKVTLIDNSAPGMETSFGNAGLFADYARTPFARFSTLRQMPSLIMDKQSSLSINAGYSPKLMRYGWHFFNACFEANFQKITQTLNALQERARQADQFLIDLSEANHLIKKNGCIGLFSNQAGFEKAKRNELAERQALGVDLKLLDKRTIKDLEPNLADFYHAGVLYPNTRFTTDPAALCQQYFSYFLSNNGRFINHKALFIDPHSTKVQVHTTSQIAEFDQLVIAAGFSSKALLKQLEVNVPIVSERGYHLTLADRGNTLSHAVGWLDKSMFLTPMSAGIRVAGTAEFASPDTPPDRSRIKLMQRNALTMLNDKFETSSSWVGSRASTPDTLPVIGPLKDHPNIISAFGHGHLGLTLAAITGQLVKDIVLGSPTKIDISALSSSRF